MLLLPLSYDLCINNNGAATRQITLPARPTHSPFDPTHWQTPVGRSVGRSPSVGPWWWPLDGASHEYRFFGSCRSSWRQQGVACQLRTRACRSGDEYVAWVIYTYYSCHVVGRCNHIMFQLIAVVCRWTSRHPGTAWFETDFGWLVGLVI